MRRRGLIALTRKRPMRLLKLALVLAGLYAVLAGAGGAPGRDGGGRRRSAPGSGYWSFASAASMPARIETGLFSS
jgi:hypothetical protein